MYNYLQVRETEDRTILSTNVLFGVQSVMMKEEGLTGMYYDYALAAPVMAGLSNREAGSVLVLGNGTGTFAHQCTTYFPNLQVEGVETVSYTHLDVYKRQGCARRCGNTCWKVG